MMRTTCGHLSSWKVAACSCPAPACLSGDCILTADNSDETVATKYNFCVKAHRRTTYTNLDRVFTMTFTVRAPSTT